MLHEWLQGTRGGQYGHTWCALAPVQASAAPLPAARAMPKPQFRESLTLMDDHDAYSSRQGTARAPLKAAPRVGSCTQARPALLAGFLLKKKKNNSPTSTVLVRCWESNAGVVPGGGITEGLGAHDGLAWRVCSSYLVGRRHALLVGRRHALRIERQFSIFIT